MGLILMLGIWLAIFIVDHFLSLRPDAISLIVRFRTIMGLAFFTMLLPSAFFTEFWYSQWKKRTFRIRNVAMLSIGISWGILLAVVISSFFEIFFPGLELASQGLILDISIGIAVLTVVVATIKNRRIHSLFKKAFE
jgi:hypothetical protein